MQARAHNYILTLQYNRNLKYRKYISHSHSACLTRGIGRPNFAGVMLTYAYMLFIKILDYKCIIFKSIHAAFQYIEFSNTYYNMDECDIPNALAMAATIYCIIYS